MSLFSKKQEPQTDKEEDLILYKVVLALYPELIPRYDQEGDLSPFEKKECIRMLEKGIPWIYQLRERHEKITNEKIEKLSSDNKQLKEEINKLSIQKDYLETELLLKINSGE